MIAVVYSGSKSAFWKIANNGKTIADCTMPSINPCFNDPKHILYLLAKNNELINYAEQVKRIYVFAAGASSLAKQKELADTLSIFFKNSKITVKDDLYGASIAACFNETGIVGILGSGSNCAYYDGKNPEHNNYGLGFILGDEGSANYLGKMLLKKYLEDKLPEDLRLKFEEKYNTDRPIILERVYKKPHVQHYLSSFLDFYIENRTHKYIVQLIDCAFESYFKIYLLPVTVAHPNKEIHFVGTVAGTFQDRLRTIAQKHDINIITITKEPIYNLLNYYSN
jgi:N-acetylglucosamine kinase-like BadF-type ATPase